MKTLSPLATAILPLLTWPMTVSQVFRALPHATPQPDIETALDELIPHFATCDEDGRGGVYFYRRDTIAEHNTYNAWETRRRAADTARSEAIAAAERAYVVAMNKADEERDAADPMASIKAKEAA